MSVLEILNRSKKENKKLLGVLLDPDKAPVGDALKQFINCCEEIHADIILAGGSLITKGNLGELIREIKSHTKVPVLIFPGDASQISKDADAILLLSLISGRNPEFLIGQHVAAAPHLKQAGIEIIPTGYLLIESGIVTTASYISNTVPVPSSKNDIAACTALAGEQLGMKVIYLDGGSGAKQPVPASMINTVCNFISIPLIVGGGIRDLNSAKAAWNAGADLVVIGSLFESNPNALEEFRKR
jgi:phosphoglycerol geranylgeranyltransferase